MLSVKQRNLLIAAVIFYALSLAAFLRLEPWMFIVVFAVHSVLLLAFSYVCVKDSSLTTDEVDELTDRITSVKTEWKAESEHYKAELFDRDETIRRLEEQLNSANVSNLELTDKIKELELAAVNTASAMDSEEDAASDFSSVLPDYLPAKSETSTVNIIDVARSVSREFSDEAAKAGLTVNISSSDELLLVRADQNLLRTLFRNIVDNSIKYMNRHGSLIITISSVGDDIFVVCKDTGEGLSENETEHIFELNYQGSNRISGNGLGLFQAKAIVSYYGGTIYAKSNTGKGMGIYIQLPTV